MSGEAGPQSLVAENGDGYVAPPPLPCESDVITEGCFVVLDQHRVDEKLSIIAVHRSKCVHQHAHRRPRLPLQFTHAHPRLRLRACFFVPPGPLAWAHTTCR